MRMEILSSDKETIADSLKIYADDTIVKYNDVERKLYYVGFFPSSLFKNPVDVEFYLFYTDSVELRDYVFTHTSVYAEFDENVLRLSYSDKPFMRLEKFFAAQTNPIENRDLQAKSDDR